jgi:hypothetical protein
MQGLEAHGRISPTRFHGEKLWCPGLRAGKAWSCRTAPRQSEPGRCRPPAGGGAGDLARGVSPSAARCAQLVARLEMCGAKLSKRLFTISG